MKKLIIAMLLIAPLNLMAQKIGSYSLQAVVENMPAYKTAQSRSTRQSFRSTSRKSTTRRLRTW